MKSKEYIINIIANHKDRLFVYGIRKIGLFGSYSRGDQNKNSDLDILIEFYPDKENFDNYMAAYDYIEALFKNYKVEIVTKNGLSPFIAPKILKEVKYA